MNDDTPITPEWEIPPEESGESRAWDPNLVNEKHSQEDLALLQNQLARAKADYQNLARRHEQDMANLGFMMISQVLLKILPSIDNLERAFSAKENYQSDSWIDGIHSTYEWLMKSLESIGMKPFTSLWSEVDPDRHEVVMQSQGKNSIIIGEVEKGYMLHDRVLRHAKVVVGNGESDDSEKT